ncbi:MAG: patatin-like phospholipase family protein [Planctomycetota bacterium]|nr:MAG: patatin-like phospholipase family protein [Planctomycetota bacterium]
MERVGGDPTATNLDEVRRPMIEFPRQTRHSRGGLVLALGGGGARGLAHFGVFQAICEAGWEVQRIVGTSMGALAGAMLASRPPKESPEQCAYRATTFLSSERFCLQQQALYGVAPGKEQPRQPGVLGWLDGIRHYLRSRSLCNRVLSEASLLRDDVLVEAIEQLVPDIDIAEAETPLSVVAVDLRSGHQIVLERGSLRKAVQASMSIPGIFPPVAWDDMLLCDFGVLESLPTEIAACYGEGLVVGVDVGPTLERAVDCESALHVLLRMDEIGERLFRRHALTHADLVIRPEVGRFEWWDFSHPQGMMQAGLEAARAALRQLEDRPPLTTSSSPETYDPICNKSGKWGGRLFGLLRGLSVPARDSQ